MPEQQKVVNPWIVAIAVMFSTFMEVLDTTVVNVSLPHIAGDLSVTPEEATWALTSYLVANAIILPITGWLATFFGRKRLLMMSVIGFTAASFLCGFSPTLPFLIVCRILQGAAGGRLQPLSQAVLLEAFHPRIAGKPWASGDLVLSWRQCSDPCLAPRQLHPQREARGFPAVLGWRATSSQEWLQTAAPSRGRSQATWSRSKADHRHHQQAKKVASHGNRPWRSPPNKVEPGGLFRKGRSQCGRDIMDFHESAEHDRDRYDHRFTTFLQACTVSEVAMPRQTFARMTSVTPPRFADRCWIARQWFRAASSRRFKGAACTGTGRSPARMPSRWYAPLVEVSQFFLRRLAAACRIAEI